MTFSASWRLADTDSREGIDALSAELADGPLAQQTSLLQDPRWLCALADEPVKSVRAYVCRSGNALVGYAGFLVHPSALRLAIGELTLFSRSVRRLWSFAAPVFAATFGAEETRDAVAALLHQLRRDLAPDEVVFLESVAQGTASMDLLKEWEAEPHGFHVLQYGELYQHHSALLGDSFDAYLKQLGSRTRSDLRSTRKKFVARVDSRYRTQCFRASGDVPEFVRDAIAVSQKTYQYHLLGAGLRVREALEQRYTATAQQGWFRSYILYVKEKPVAFQVGHLYGGRYHAQEIGYDPEWARQHVGIFLHTEIVAELSASGESVRWFDFGIGDSQHKQRMSTHAILGGYYYLIPDTWRGSLMANAMRATNSASGAIGAALERVGLRHKTRQFLRKLGAAR
jgi:CelD/BcsL family acetyltransferase involved in cellulose biosynthesis